MNNSFNIFSKNYVPVQNFLCANKTIVGMIMLSKDLLTPPVANLLVK